MPQIVVTIDGKTYRMACAEGEEDHLHGLAAAVDARIADLRRDVGEIGDLRLTVMAAITATDELSEARVRIAALEADLAATTAGRDDASRAAASGETAFVGHLNALSGTMERIAAKLERRP